MSADLSAVAALDKASADYTTVRTMSTDAGTIPGDWKVKPLSQWAEKIMVGIASAATYAYRPTGVPLLRNQNIKPGYLADDEILYVDPSYELRLAKTRLVHHSQLKLALPPDKYSTNEKIIMFYRELIEKLNSSPSGSSLGAPFIRAHHRRGNTGFLPRRP